MASSNLFWLDGSPTNKLPLPDRGLYYGDGLFETLLLKDGRPLFLEKHLERLRRGMKVLAFIDCEEAVREHLHSAVSAAVKSGWNWSVLRLTVTRGSGPRGYAPPGANYPRILIEVGNLPQDCDQMGSPAELCVADIRLSSQPRLAGVKHLNRLEQVLAAAYSRSRGVDESIVLDQSERVISVVAGNVFTVHRGKLFTPRLVDCGVTGTRRSLILEKWAPALGLEVSETDLNLVDILGADAVFYSNSLLCVRPVLSLGKRSWADFSVCQAIFQCYLDEVA